MLRPRYLFLLVTFCLLVAPLLPAAAAESESAEASAAAAPAPASESTAAIAAVGETLTASPAPQEPVAQGAAETAAATGGAAPEEALAAEDAVETEATQSATAATATETATVADPLAGLSDSPSDLTKPIAAEEIQLAQAGLTGATELEESQRLELQALYDQALAKVESAAALEATCAEYTAAIERAPELLAELQARLAESETPPPLTLPEAMEALEQLKQQLTADLLPAETKVNDLTRQRDDRQARPARVAEERETLQKRLTAITEELAALQETTAAARAQRTLLLAEQREARARDHALELELQRNTATEACQAISLTLAQRRLTTIQQQLERVTREISTRRTAEAARQAAEARQMAAAAHPLLRELAELNVELTERNVELREFIRQTDTLAGSSTLKKERLASNYRRLRDRIEHTDRSDSIGRLLHEYRLELPDLAALHRDARERKRTLDGVNLARIELEDQLDLWNEEQKNNFAGRVLASLPLASEQERADMLLMINETLAKRTTNAETLLQSYSDYESSLRKLDEAQAALVTEAEAFSDYIAENSLWVADLKPIGGSDAAAVATAGGQLFSLATWSTVAELVFVDVLRRPFYWAAILVGMTALLPWSRRLRSQLAMLGRRMETGLFETSFVVTLKGIALTAAIAAPWPLLVVFLGWRIRAASSFDAWTAALGAGLLMTGGLYFLLEFMRQVCRPNGLAEAHFDWPIFDLMRIRHRLGWPMILGLPLLLIVSSTVSAGFEPATASVGRLAFLACMIMLVAWLPLLALPVGSIVAAAFGHAEAAWRRRWQVTLGAMAILSPVGLTVLACLGYYYTAVQLGWRLAATAAVAVGMLLVHAVLVRALLVARKQRAEAEASEAQVDTTGSRSGRRPQFPLLNPAVTRIEVRQVVRKLTIVGGLAAGWATWSHVLPALQFLETKHITLGTTTISVWSLVMASMLALLAFMASKNLPELLEVTILQRLPLDGGGRYALATLIRYAVTGIGIWWVFHVLQFRWDSIQWLLAAMSVGLGFGLQEVVANFVCGLIILFERPIRVGDIVTVGDMQGKVARIRIRATTILDWDHRELLVPNKEFITNRLVNWTLSDPVTRVVIPVGIAYGSDTSLARKLLMKVAKESPLVMTEPAPSALFLGFGDSALNFELRVFLPDRNYWAELIDNLHSRIDAEFREAGIEIAFPQCDIHVRSIDGVLATRQLMAGGKRADADEEDTELEADAAEKSHKDAA